MGVPTQAVTLTPAQLEDLNTRLSEMRHAVNNQLSLIMAAAELIRYKPELRERMAASLTQQPGRITEEMAKFSAEFERTLRITRDF
jgi:hypothetical protein